MLPFHKIAGYNEATRVPLALAGHSGQQRSNTRNYLGPTIQNTKPPLDAWHAPQTAQDLGPQRSHTRNHQGTFVWYIGTLGPCWRLWATMKHHTKPLWTMHPEASANPVHAKASADACKPRHPPPQCMPRHSPTASLPRHSPTSSIPRLLSTLFIRRPPSTPIV